MLYYKRKSIAQNGRFEQCMRKTVGKIIKFVLETHSIYTSLWDEHGQIYNIQQTDEYVTNKILD